MRNMDMGNTIRGGKSWYRKYQTYLLQLLHKLIGGRGNIGVGSTASRMGTALGGMALHEQALEKEDQLIAVENSRAKQVEALEELGMGRVAAGQGRLVGQELLPREVGPSPLEEGRLGGGGLDG